MLDIFLLKDHFLTQIFFLSFSIDRLITSGYLQKEEAFFSSFIEGDRTVKEFCHQVSFVINLKHLSSIILLIIILNFSEHNINLPYVIIKLF